MLERSRRLRQKVHAETEALRLKMQALQKEVAAIKAKMKKLQIPLNDAVECSAWSAGQVGQPQ